MASQFTVFVSHVAEDESIAVGLKRLLETVFLNAKVFVAGRDLAGGEVWVKEIRDQLRVARVIIAVITPFSRNTPWVMFEAGAGFVDSRTIPVCAFEVSRRIREEFENGRDYYALHGHRIHLPIEKEFRPALDFITWHNEKRFFG
jgi:hypothetical protein